MNGNTMMSVSKKQEGSTRRAYDVQKRKFLDVLMFLDGV